VDRTPELPVEKGYLDKASRRQHLSRELPKSGRFDKIDSNVVVDPIDSSFSGFEELDSVCGAYKRRAECLSRLAAQKSASSSRVGARLSVLPLGDFSRFSSQVDLMATSLNHRLPLYLSPFLDPQAVAVDTMSLDWNR